MEIETIATNNNDNKSSILKELCNISNKYCCNLSWAELLTFLNDFWIELKRYDPIIGLLTAWGAFEAPTNFQERKFFRFILLVTQVFITIGLTIQLHCLRNPMAEGAAVMISVTFITIPIEILNVIWFRIVKSSEEMKNISAKKGCCCGCLAWTIQYIGKFFGSIIALGVFSYAIVFFVLAFVGIHPGCTKTSKFNLVWNVILYQFLLVPMFMCFPYWREEGVMLSLLGELGPVIGLVIHLRKHGLHPRPPVMTLRDEKKEAQDVENPVQTI